MAWGFDTSVADTSSYGGNGGHPGQGIGYTPSGPTQAGQAGLSRLDNEIWGQRRDVFGNILGGLGVAQALAMAKHAKTGAGKSWMPNWAYSKVHPGAPASTGSWWQGGKMPLGLKGTFFGAKPTLPGTLGLAAGVGYGSYLGTKGLLNMTGGTQHLRNFGSYLAGLGDQ